jgi:hypothetical protein
MDSSHEEIVRTREHFARAYSDVMGAVAVVVEGGDPECVTLAPARHLLGRMHGCHTDAAILALALLCDSLGMTSEQVRDLIPGTVASILTAEFR